MKQQVNQRRISVDGDCETWMHKTVEALESVGFQAIKVDDMRVRADFVSGRRRGSITVKCQGTSERSVLHIATLGGRGDSISDAFVQALLVDD